MSLVCKVSDPVDLLKEDIRMAILAPSNCGKTYYILYLLKYYLINKYKFIFLVIGAYNDIYDSAVWPNHIYRVGSKDQLNTVINNILTFGESLVASGYKSKKILLIIDDVGSLGRGSSGINTLMIRGRNANISTIYLTQSYNNLDKDMRANLTHLCLYTMTSGIETFIRDTRVSDSKEYTKIVNKIFNRLADRKKKGDTERYNLMLNLESNEITVGKIPLELLPTLISKNILMQQYSSMKDNEEAKEEWMPGADIYL